MWRDFFNFRPHRLRPAVLLLVLLAIPGVGRIVIDKSFEFLPVEWIEARNGFRAFLMLMAIFLPAAWLFVRVIGHQQVTGRYREFVLQSPWQPGMTLPAGTPLWDAPSLLAAVVGLAVAFSVDVRVGMIMLAVFCLSYGLLASLRRPPRAYWLWAMLVGLLPLVMPLVLAAARGEFPVGWAMAWVVAIGVLSQFIIGLSIHTRAEGPVGELEGMPVATSKMTRGRGGLFAAFAPLVVEPVPLRRHFVPALLYGWWWMWIASIFLGAPRQQGRPFILLACLSIMLVMMIRAVGISKRCGAGIELLSLGGMWHVLVSRRWENAVVWVPTLSALMLIFLPLVMSPVLDLRWQPGVATAVGVHSSIAYLILMSVPPSPDRLALMLAARLPTGRPTEETTAANNARRERLRVQRAASGTLGG
jgi:hypothetical protein